jgi:hypothetical protein
VLEKVEEGVGEQAEEIRGLVDALKRVEDGDGDAGFPELVPLDAVDFVGRGLS